MPPPQPLDPGLAAAIEALPPVDLRDDALPALRERQRRAAADVALSDAVTRTDHVMDARRGVPVRVRVHRPVGTGGALPCVVSLHGGGLVVGSHLADDALFDRWCPALGVVGVSVDYRLAPEHRYPAALEDAYAALAWARTDAGALGVDPARIGLRGVSAGAGIAAAVTLLARERGEPPAAFQLLDAPMLDDRQVTPSSRLDGLPVWTRESNAFGWRSYLGDRYGTASVPATAAPARATDLSGLPPAFVSVGSVDGFRDEAVDYATRLNRAGVPCELHVYAGAPHGYHLAGDTPLARRARRDATDWLGRVTAT
jgi:acetyl esterase/lipase